MLAGQLAVWTQQPDEARRLLRRRAGRARAGWSPDCGPGWIWRARRCTRSSAITRAARRSPIALAPRRARRATACWRRRRRRGRRTPRIAGCAAKIRGRWRRSTRKSRRPRRWCEALPDDRVAQRLSMLVALGIAQTFTGRLRAASATFERGLGLARSTGHGLFAPAFVAGRGLIAEFERPVRRRRGVRGGGARERAAVRATLRSPTGRRSAAAQSRWPVARSRRRSRTRRWRGSWWGRGRARRSASRSPTRGSPRAIRTARSRPLDAFEWVSPQLWTFDRVRAAEVAVRVLLALGRVQEAAALASRAPAEGGGRRCGIFGAVLAHAEAAVLPRAGRAGGGGTHGARRRRRGRSRRRRRCGARAAASSSARPCWPAAARPTRAASCARRPRSWSARGAWGYRDAALRLLRRLGDRPATQRRRRRPATGRWPRSRRASVRSPALVADGQTNAQIAARLQLSESTVEKHVSRALGKLGMSTRAGLIQGCASGRRDERFRGGVAGIRHTGGPARRRLSWTSGRHRRPASNPRPRSAPHASHRPCPPARADPPRRARRGAARGARRHGAALRGAGQLRDPEQLGRADVQQTGPGNTNVVVRQILQHVRVHVQRGHHRPHR